jgi:hypothetical protein
MLEQSLDIRAALSGFDAVDSYLALKSFIA